MDFLPSHVYASVNNCHLLKLKGWDEIYVLKFLTNYLFQISSNHNFIDGHLLCDFGLKRWDL